jgi:hypothetical protein
VPIDDLPGEPRNADLAFVCTVPGRDSTTMVRRLAVSVEAKADESLGQRVRAVEAAAIARRATGKASNADIRARALVAAILGPDTVGDPDVQDLRYQLLTATAGALAYARAQRADVAVLVIHEFVHVGAVHTRPARLAANSRDIDAFLARLSQGRCPGLTTACLTGPFRVAGNTFLPAEIPLLIGKAQRVLP